MTLEELAISNSFEIGALVNVLERKGLTTMQEALEEIRGCVDRQTDMTFCQRWMRTTKSIVTPVLFCVCLLFTGCATQRYAAPDTVPLKPSKPYVVQGKRYEPLATAEGFVQEGLASSYGRDFHGKKTSSGEPFDLQAMTAAHKTLPFGVYVKVEHKRTGKEVTVCINDRGPFVGNRIIDLSEGAASRLGMLQEGITPVRISALGYKSGDNYRQLSSYDKGNYTIQVGAFTVKENAYRYMEGLKRQYGMSDVQDSWVKNTRYYRVRLGRFESLKLAQDNKETYEQKGFKGCFVVAVD